mgnify:CR=1 FL=1
MYHVSKSDGLLQPLAKQNRFLPHVAGRRRAARQHGAALEITVQGNPRVYKAMKQELAFLCARLSESGFLPDSDWAARLDHLLLLLDGMKEV